MPDFWSFVLSKDWRQFKSKNMKFVLGKKLEMGTRFLTNGTAVPVTLISVPQNIVTGIKGQEKDGYVSVQVGAGEVRNLSKAEKGHLKDLAPVRHLREFRVDDAGAWKRGDELKVAQFQAGEKVNVIGTSKGRGFQGVVKRHHFHGHPSSHGHKDQERMPGSIGAGGVQHVRKGTRMAGRMGGDRVTVKNLEIIEVNAEKNTIAVRGAIPGARGGFLMVVGA